MKRADIEPPPRLGLRDRWRWIRLYCRRHDAITDAMERGEGLKEIQTYLDRIGELEGVRGQTGTRDALEIWNMGVLWVREHRPDWVQARIPKDPFPFLNSSMFSSCDDFLPSSVFSRLEHSTITALDNEELLQAREAEDKMIDRHIQRALKKFEGTFDGTRGGLDGWMDRYCLGDPELAHHTLQLIDSESGREALELLTAPWKVTPEKTDETLNPIWWNYETPRQEEYRKQVAQLSEDLRPFSAEMEEYVQWREELIREFAEIVRDQREQQDEM